MTDLGSVTSQLREFSLTRQERIIAPELLAVDSNITPAPLELLPDYAEE